MEKLRINNQDISVEKELTLAEYEALSYAEKHNGTVYYITDDDSTYEESAISSNLASVYDETASYTVGMYVIRNKRLYKCISDTTGVWVGSAWEQVIMAEEFLALQNTIAAIPAGASLELEEEVAELKKSVADGKASVASAITNKGVQTASDATFATLAENVSKIDTEPSLQNKSILLSGSSQIVTADGGYYGLSSVEVPAVEGTAYEADVLDGVTFSSANGNNLTGGMANLTNGSITAVEVSADANYVYMTTDDIAGYIDSSTKMVAPRADVALLVGAPDYTGAVSSAGVFETIDTPQSFVYKDVVAGQYVVITATGLPTDTTFPSNTTISTEGCELLASTMVKNDALTDSVTLFTYMYKVTTTGTVSVTVTNDNSGVAYPATVAILQ